MFSFFEYFLVYLQNYLRIVTYFTYLVKVY